MGATIAQHPEAASVVIAEVGIFDMLRYEQSPNGSFNVPEYGSVRVPAQFKALYNYSPYHGLKEGIRYPSVLLMTGENDARVDPMHSRKMAARLQAVTASPRPILLLTSKDTGHGHSTPLAGKIEQETAKWTFIFDQLNLSLE